MEKEKIMIEDITSAINHIRDYFTVLNENVVTVQRLDISKILDKEQRLLQIEKSGKENPFTAAIVETERKGYYLKFDRNCWYNAGYETGKFSGSGFAINRDIYEQLIEPNKLDILYINPPSTCYYFTFDNFRQNCYHHLQRFNREHVLVVSLYMANDVWHI